MVNTLNQVIMEKNSFEVRSYEAPAVRIRPIEAERLFLASATIPVYGETEEEGW